MKHREKVRSLFISDTHLGSRHCKAEALLDFLKHIQPETLYLVGDIIDGWKLRRRMYWNDTYSFIVRRIIGMMKDNTKIYYIAGNHDEFLRNFLPNDFGHLQIVDHVIHRTIDGKKFLVIHGDIFDTITIHAKWLYFIGDTAYEFAMSLNTAYNWWRRKMGQPYWSLSAVLKKNVKKAVNYINSFEHCVAKYTKNKDCQGVVCGHVHTPAIKTFEGIEYFNCGDWVESCTALVEHYDGSMELRNYGNPLAEQEKCN